MDDKSKPGASLEDEKNPDRRVMMVLDADRFLDIRKAIGLTQEQLAEILSFEQDDPIAPKTIRDWEKGNKKMPSWVMSHMERLFNSYVEKVQNEAEQSGENASSFKILREYSLSFLKIAKSSMDKRT